MEKLKGKHLRFMLSPQNKTTINFSLCIICQNKTKNEKLYKLTDIRRVVSVLQVRCKCNLAYRALKKQSYEPDFHEKEHKWHKACCKKFLRCKHHNKTADQASATEESIQIPPALPGRTQSQAGDVEFDYKTCCLFCSMKGSTKNKKLNVYQIRTLDRQNKVRRQAEELWQQNPEFLARCKDKDLIALEAKYHQRCMLKFLSSKPDSDGAFRIRAAICSEMLEDICPKLLSGRIYATTDLTVLFGDYLKRSGLEWEDRDMLLLKRKLKDRFGRDLRVNRKSGRHNFFYLKTH